MPPNDTSARPTEARNRIIVLVTMVLAGAAFYAAFGDRLQLDYLATQETNLRTFQSERPGLVYGVAFAIYVAVTGLSLPGAAVLSMAYGWYFGFLPGVILVSFASTAGATIAFLLSRYLLKDLVIRHFGARLINFNESL